MTLSQITRDHILAAIKEYDTRGPQGFHDQYQYAGATRYWLRYEGKDYPSKGIVGAAHIVGLGERLPHLSGGAGPISVLTDLGFTVVDDHVGSDPEPPPHSDSVWVVRAGEHGKYASEFETLGLVIAGWRDVGELTGFSEQAIRAKVESVAPAGTLVGPWVAELNALVNRIAVGDIVVTPVGTHELLVGRVIGEYHYAPQASVEDWGQTRTVNWIGRRERGDLPERTKSALASRNTVFELKEAQPIIDWVLAQEQQSCWWVNQGQSYKQERAGGFMWSPQVAKDGSKRPYYQAMLEVAQGDAAIHYSQNAIRAIGRALGPGRADTRPPGLQETWNKEGYRVDVEYFELEKPIQLSEIPMELRVPVNGPFTAVGSVKEGYLYKPTAELVDALVARFGDRWPPGSPFADWKKVPKPMLTLEDIAKSIRSQGMRISDKMVRRFHISLMSRGFVILSGVSGTGKTWLGEAYAARQAQSRR